LGRVTKRAHECHHPLSCELSKLRVIGVALFIRGRRHAQQLRVRRDSRATVPLKRR
jgi:hypothetical protein